LYHHHYHPYYIATWELWGRIILLQMMLDPNLSTLIITQQQQQQQQPYSYISMAQIDRQVTSDNPGIKL